jgi:membrane-associated phospholipid phosphatase
VSLGLLPRFLAHLREKIAVLLGLAIGICVPYFVLGRIQEFPLCELPVTPLDDWVDFDPRWIWPYLSIALLVPLSPLLATGRECLRRYARGLALLCLICFASFLLFPVEGPRPQMLPDHDMYRLLVSYDSPSNSLPSLHAGLTLYSMLFAFRVLRDAVGRRGRFAIVAVGSTWGAVILYATLATKQHWAIDLVAGLLVAFLAHRLVWRKAPC